MGFAAAAMVIAGAAPVSAERLAQAECQKIDAERRALMVLGVDKYVEKGPDWAKTNLTVADLDLVKRYFDLFEQLKFRCQEDMGITEIDEPDTVDDDDAPQTASQAGKASANATAQGSGTSAAPTAVTSGASLPKAAPAPAAERRTKPLGGQSSAAAAPAYTGSTSSIEKAVDTNTTSIAKRPRQVAPAQ
jgi:hypothetical protein